MERCALCGEEFPSRPDFDRHVCRGLVRPVRRRPSRWAIEALFLTAVLAAAFVGAQDEEAGTSPVLIGSLFALYTVFTATSIWGLFRIHSDDVADWPRHMMPRWEYAIFYESRVSRVGLALMMLAIWIVLLVAWFGS